ncbi:cytoplasmic protein [Methylobacterium sp. WL30]|uniref:BrnA antitoxin family protein n=1 Tax=unclassified Methylobacterium TaxID=2615210 RepID=UPI0011C791B6|nr:MULTISPECIES: BrnA antitoxin family protein [unclassified Methylobacterium]TXM90092.1 cytoplasmic protein [Methylobacterium sp. WL116]TXN33696.1 cytoplasmic protein [Methylobacterium sp. WL93]TXN49448.1 cytoplasmic protein [Methylobacterium sp. WL119]TXN68642.1 cytoplasmic protein [Methylobacterium sp. WL30]
MNTKLVSYEIDLANPPTLSEAQTAELEALAAKPDAEIDHSDIPTLTEAFWQNAVRNPFYRPVKTSTTVRIDADVLGWLRAPGRGYQTRINAILRREMLAALRKG